MTLQAFGELLLTVTDQVYHYEASGEIPGRYIVWQETGGRAIHGSGSRREVIRELLVDFCTKTEFDPVLDLLLETLADHGIAFQEPVTAFDTEIKIIHHTVKCEMT